MGTVVKSAKPSSRKHEVHVADIPIEQIPPVSEVGDEESPDIHQNRILVDPALKNPLPKSYLDELAFNEEPVTVMFTPGDGRFAAPFVDAAVMGVGIEVMAEDGRWIEMWQVPVGVEVTMRRKYLEVFARCKHTDVKAYSRGIPQEGNPINDTLRTTNVKYPFAVIEDKNPRGAQWLQSIIRPRA